MKKTTKSGLIILVFVAAIFTAHSCLAISSLVDTSDPNYKSGNYTLTSVRDYAVYIMQLILGLVGTLSLAMFVYGGLTFLLSTGNQSQVTKGMDIIKAAVVGLLLVFSSVLIINLFFKGLFGTGDKINDSGTTWSSTTGAIILPKTK